MLASRKSNPHLHQHNPLIKQRDELPTLTSLEADKSREKREPKIIIVSPTRPSSFIFDSSEKDTFVRMSQKNSDAIPDSPQLKISENSYFIPHRFSAKTMNNFTLMYKSYANNFQSPSVSTACTTVKEALNRNSSTSVRAKRNIIPTSKNHQKSASVDTSTV